MYYLDVFYGFSRAVTYDDRGYDFLAVMVYLSVQRNFQTDFSMRKRESLANQRTRQSLSSRRRSVL